MKINNIPLIRSKNFTNNYLNNEVSCKRNLQLFKDDLIEISKNIKTLFDSKSIEFNLKLVASRDILRGKNKKGIYVISPNWFLARGSFKLVKRGIFITENKIEKVVILIVSRPKKVEVKNFKENIKKEVNISKKLKEITLPIKILILADDKAILFSQRVKYNLCEYLDSKILTVEERLRLCKGVIRCIKFMFEKKILHRDIKAENFLINTTGRIKIIDFGLSVETKDNYLLSKIPMGTQGWANHDKDKDKYIYNEKTDIFSMGITLYNLAINSSNQGLYSRPPSKTERQKEFLEKSLNSTKNNDKEAKNLITAITGMCKKDITQRISMGQILKLIKM